MANEENLKAPEGVEDDGFEIEIADDTPEEDRGREPMPKEIVQKLEEDELDEYSVEKAKQLKKVWHDERRAKEAALREREEAVRYAQRIAQENQQLKKNLGAGERVYMGTAKQAYENELAMAKRELKEANDSGDSDRITDAQEKLVEAKLKLRQVEAYRPQYDEEALQAQNIGVDTPNNGEWSAPPVQNAAPAPDHKAIAWRERNPWFGPNRVMTSMAFGLHEDLVSEGVDPNSEEYYARIDKEMRRRFPENFENAKDEKPKRAAPVVASVKRSTAPTKVKLTETQVSIAKRLGLTPEQYAKELIKLGEINV